MGNHKTLSKEPELVIKNGKPTSVILAIEQYRELLERIEDIEDLAELRKIRTQTLRFRRIEDFLREIR
jgi:transcription elongation GreA/GreB family factor